MILKKEIQEKAELWNVSPSTVDKDYVLGHFLSAFYETANNQELFAFKGGTLLRKCYFSGFRFSEDLDYTLLDRSFIVTKEFFEEIADYCASKSGIRFWVQKFEAKQFEGQQKGYTCIVRFWGANHGRNEMPVPKERWTSKIEIDITYDEELLTPLKYRSIIHEYSDRAEISEMKIPVYSFIEILIEKVRSFYQRNYKAPRDFFDVWYLMNNVTFDESVDIAKLLIEKCAIKNVKIDPDIFNDEQTFKIVSRAWKSSIAHHLPEDKLPEIEEVWEYLANNLFSKLIKL